ncbi:MAG TPA: transposase [Atribacterota bacterium]|nr:transposase [Atribacterota bacterium]
MANKNINKLPTRKNIRLKNYDYSNAGYFFITICTKNKQNYFWENIPTNMDSQFQNPILSEFGKLVDREINTISSIYENVEIDKYIIMPNHLHMIIVLHQMKPAHTKTSEHRFPTSNDGGRSENAPTEYDEYLRNVIKINNQNENIQNKPAISRIVKQFKGSISKQLGFSLWQKSFFDHIIRNEQEYQKIWNYIEENPLRWIDDQYYTG